MHDVKYNIFNNSLGNLLIFNYFKISLEERFF